MSEPSIDLEKPNVLGGLDKLLTHFAIAIIAVFPTYFVCIAAPWRLRPLINKIEPDGRKGMLLSPGAFFFLSLMGSFIIAAILSTPETRNYNGAYLGPNLAFAVQTAASEGNVWKLIGTIMPIYGTAIFLGLTGRLLKPWANQNWSFQISLRAAFYGLGVLLSWIILTTTAIDLIRLKSGNNNIVSTLIGLSSPPMLLAFIWMYAGFFRNEGRVSWKRSLILALAMVAITTALIVGLAISLTSIL